MSFYLWIAFDDTFLSFRDGYLDEYDTLNTATVCNDLINRHLSKQQDRKCTYNVISRRVHATFVAEEKQLVLHILRVCL